MNKGQLKGSVMLLLTATIWGSTFVAQKEGVNSVGPFTFIGARMLLGAAALIPVILVMDFIKKKADKSVKILKPTKTDLLGGAICGVVLFVASSLQQIGLSLYGDNDAAAGKSGFLTALYIVIVPIIGLFLKKKAAISVWVSVFIAATGMYFLCVGDSFEIATADIAVLLCAVMFSVHILVIDSFADKTDGVKLSAIQFFTAGVLGTIVTFVFETPTVDGIIGAGVPILYVGLLSCGVAYTLQIVAQKYTKPTVAAVIMSLESVFAVIAGTLFGEKLTERELIGCVLVFIAVILAQIDVKSVFRKNVIIKE